MNWLRRSVPHFMRILMFTDQTEVFKHNDTEFSPIINGNSFLSVQPKSKKEIHAEENTTEVNAGVLMQNTFTYIHIRIYLYIYMCVYVCTFNNVSVIDIERL